MIRLRSLRSRLVVGALLWTIGAGLRLGWVIAPEEVIQKVAGLKPDGGTSPFASSPLQEALPVTTVDVRERRCHVVPCVVETLEEWAQPVPIGLRCGDCG